MTIRAIDNYEELRQLAGYTVFERFQKAHLKWVNAALTKAEPRRETRWTEAPEVRIDPYALTRNQYDTWLAQLASEWGGVVGMDYLAPSRRHDPASQGR